MIVDKNLTVVVQGNVVRSNDKVVPTDSGRERKSGADWTKNYDVTKSLLESIRDKLPYATIILSTYKNSNIKGLDYDLLVESDDPGAEGEIHKGQSNNINRILKTSLAGIKKANTEYVLKIRSDSYISGTYFINIYNEWLEEDVENNKYRLFESRVMANYLSFDPLYAKSLRQLYNINDWFVMGKKVDLINLFDIPLLDRNSPKIKKLAAITPDKSCEAVYVPEQYIIIEYIRKIKGKFSDDLYKQSFVQKFDCLQYMLNNFVFINSFDHGIRHFKHESENFINNNLPELKKTRMTYSRFNKYYNRSKSKSLIYRVIYFTYFAKRKSKKLNKKKNSKIAKLSLNLICLFIPSKKLRKKIRKTLLDKSFINLKSKKENLYLNNKVIIVKEDKTEKYLNHAIDGLKITINGTNNTIKIAEPYSFNNTSITCNGNNAVVEIEENIVVVDSLKIECAAGNGQYVKIGKNSSFVSSYLFLHMNEAKLSIGENCMFSFAVNVMAHDGHSIMNKDKTVILNKVVEPLMIEDHVWVGANVSILKGAHILKNSIVGTGSVVTKKFKEENVVVAGNPARIIKRGINWNEHNPYIYQKLGPRVRGKKND